METRVQPAQRLISYLDGHVSILGPESIPLPIGKDIPMASTLVIPSTKGMHPILLDMYQRHATMGDLPYELDTDVVDEQEVEVGREQEQTAFDEFEYEDQVSVDDKMGPDESYQNSSVLEFGDTLGYDIPEHDTMNVIPLADETHKWNKTTINMMRLLGYTLQDHHVSVLSAG